MIIQAIQAKISLTSLLHLFAAGCLVSCGAVPSSVPPEPSGFLNDYSMLQPMPGRPGTLYFEKPGADWSGLTRLYFEPVQIKFLKGTKKDEDGQRVSEKNVRMLATYFEYTMKEAVEGKYELVDEPGAGVVRVRVAIVDLKPANALANQISRNLLYVPVDFGRAAIEGELTHSLSSERLVAIVDRKVGSVFSTSSIRSAEWGDITQAFDEWAQQLLRVLENLRGATNSDATGSKI